MFESCCNMYKELDKHSRQNLGTGGLFFFLSGAARLEEHRSCEATIMRYTCMNKIKAGPCGKLISNRVLGQEPLELGDEICPPIPTSTLGADFVIIIIAETYWDPIGLETIITESHEGILTTRE